MKDKRKIIKLSVVLTSLLVIVLSVTYAFINQTLVGNKRQVITSGNLELVLDEDENNLMITNALPMYDEVGMLQDAFTFRVINQGSIPVNYVLKLEEITVDGGLARSDVKYGLTKDNEQKIDLVSNIVDNTIDEGLILRSQTIEYSLRLWIREDVTDISAIQNKSMRFRLSVRMLQLEETEKSVVFNANGGEVTTTGKNIEIGDIYGELPIPTKEDSKFLGWYTEIDGGEKIESTSIFQSAENQTLYARWKEHYKDNTGAHRPVLKDNLIPVTIDSTGTVKKADITEEWYDYQKQEWANAIIPLNKSVTYNEGDIIPEEDIESYFVWIPRYKYKIFYEGKDTVVTSLNANAVQTIEIEFQSKNDSISSGSTKNSWLTHPAFTSFNSNGFWVGKFENGYSGAASTDDARVDSSSKEDLAKLIIKPNVYSWTDITVGNAFKISYDYNRNLDSHMMKNTEWGAVVYLSHSLFGKNSEVYTNNKNAYFTGCGGDSATETETSECKNAYGSRSDATYNQSTTGNISGVFDMGGASCEYVMGYNMNASTVGGNSGIITLYSDFFTNSKWNKYYDKYYNTSNSTAYNKRILGDATGEMGPFGNTADPDGTLRPKSSWYNDTAYFIGKDAPWFVRGGWYAYTTMNPGIFDFFSGTGEKIHGRTFRVVFSLS